MMKQKGERLNNQTSPSSVKASPKASDDDENFKKRRLQFAASLKDLKNLKKQLYSAADCFESSYNRNKHRQFVVESSKEYVDKALVSTVDHLGSVADKLNRFLDQQTLQFSATILQFSLLQQRLSTYEGFIYVRGFSPYLLKMEESTCTQPKHRILPEDTFISSGKPEVPNRSCPTSVPHDVQQLKQDNPSCKALEATKMKVDPSLLRKEGSRILASREPSPNPPRFSFSKIIPDKEAGRRSVSPLRFPFSLAGNVIKRSVSPTPSVSRGRLALEPRRAISANRRRNEMVTNNREKEMEETYTKRSKQMFKALLSFHQPRKQIVNKQIIQG